MIRTLYRKSTGSFTTDIPQAHWRAALADAGGVFWVDICAEPPAAVEPLLRDIFKFHPLAIDDALREAHVPRIDNWGEYVYAIVHAVNYDAERIELDTHEVDIFLGHNYLVTHRAEPAAIVDRVWKSVVADQRRLERGADFLLYDLLDVLVADYMPLIDALDDTVDHLEDEIFHKATPRTLNTLFSVKRIALQLRRIIGPQREVLNRLARDEYPMIDAVDRVYYRDVYDHLVRLVDINEGLRDLISGALDTYLSVTSNRINEVMKVLTIVSALFMPIAFLSGFFGMNFTWLPFNSPYLLGAAIAAMVITPLGMLMWFKRQGWM
jgi:magnesium transporter